MGYRHEWKSVPNHIKSGKKIDIHGNLYINLFRTRYPMPWSSTHTR